MDFSSLSAGVRWGGISNAVDAKVLICFVLNQIGKPVKKSSLVKSLSAEGFINYFVLSDTISALSDAGSVFVTDDSDPLLILTESGKLAAKTLEDTLSFSLRQRTVSAVSHILYREQIEAENHTEIVKLDGGYNVTLTVTDKDSDLLSVTLFVPSEEMGQTVAASFLENPELVYSGIIALLTGDKNTAADFLERYVREEDSEDLNG